MKIAQAEILGIIDDDRIGIGNVDAVFDDRGRNQHVELPVDKIHNQLFELFGRHLAVADSHPRPGAEPSNHTLKRHQILHPVVDEIDLSAPIQLGIDGVADNLLRKDMRFGNDRLSVGRRRRDDGEVARPHERELQRAGNRRRGEGQRIDIDAHLRQLLLGRYAELLLLVDNKQSQVVEFHLLAQDLVRTDQDVDATLGQLG